MAARNNYDVTHEQAGNARGEHISFPHFGHYERLFPEIG